MARFRELRQIMARKAEYRARGGAGAAAGAGHELQAVAGGGAATGCVRVAGASGNGGAVDGGVAGLFGSGEFYAGVQVVDGEGAAGVAGWSLSAGQYPIECLCYPDFFDW